MTSFRRLTPILPAAVLAVLLAPRLAAAQDFGSRLDTTVALQHGGTVDLTLVSGRITVTAWNRPSVGIKARLSSGIVRLDVSSSRVGVESRETDGGGDDSRLDVSIPADARLVLHTVSADVTAHGAAEADARTVSGDVELANVRGSASVRTVSGEVRADHVGGGFHATSVSGDIHAGDVAGETDAQTVSGDVTLAHIRAPYVHAETTSGDITMSADLGTDGRARLDSHSGDVTVELPPRLTGAHFDVRTFSGDIDTQLPMTLQPGSSSRGFMPKQMQFTIGSGAGPRYSISTFSGDLRLERGSDSNQGPR